MSLSSLSPSPSCLAPGGAEFLVGVAPGFFAAVVLGVVFSDVLGVVLGVVFDGGVAVAADPDTAVCRRLSAVVEVRSDRAPSGVDAEDDAGI